MAEKTPERAIVAALIRAKAKFKKLEKDKVNPFFKSKYADLHNVYESVDAALLSEGLVLVQPIVQENGAQYINTKLMHVSGEELPSMVKVPDAPDQQKFAASVTYLKRTAAQALLGIASQDEDDDGEEAVGRGDQRPVARVAEKPTRIITKPVPAPVKNDATPNVLGKVTNLAQKISTKTNTPFIEISMKTDEGEEEKIILKKSPENKAQQDAIDMIEKDLSAAMMSKKYVEVQYSIPEGTKNKMYAGMTVHANGEEPKL